MFFSQTLEYALRAVVWLAVQEGRSLTASELAEATQVSPGYLSKVLKWLGRGGIVRGQRGVHGGFQLARDPRELTVLEVVNAVDPIERIESCPLKLEAHEQWLCPLHSRLDEAIAHVERAFADSTIAELASSSGGRRALCNRAD